MRMKTMKALRAAAGLLQAILEASADGCAV